MLDVALTPVSPIRRWMSYRRRTDDALELPAELGDRPLMPLENPLAPGIGLAQRGQPADLRVAGGKIGLLGRRGHRRRGIQDQHSEHEEFADAARNSVPGLISQRS
ncbi:MAG: hypothetical protein K2Y27_25640 [Xanthobacteraceae bacterium]|nr:hypothetical protein [Xanthobacteraceae bacterium]